MSMRVLFNGAVLVRPGAATKIDASQFQNIVLGGLGIVGLIGEAEGGEPRTPQIFTSAAAVKTFYKSGDLVEAANIASAPGNDPRIPTGAAVLVCYKVNLSTQASLSHDTGKHVFKSRQYGFLTNSITVAIAVGVGSERIVTITDVDPFGATITEVSPALGGIGKFTMQYVGAGTPATVTITSTTLTTTITGDVPSNLTLNFSDFPSLNDLIKFIDAQLNYTASALVTNANSFLPANLDALVAGDIKTVPLSIFSRNFDVSDWINTNSQIISDTLTQGLTGPTLILTATQLAGGARGVSDNTAWVAAYTALRGVRINQLVPLASKDAITAQGTFTYASILASLTAHCKFVSSTAGRNECHGWSGMAGTKTQLIAAANLQNSEHICLFGEKIKKQRISDGAIVIMDEWATAVTAAGMRAGAPLGEPLTWKYMQAFGVTSDATWSESNNDDVTLLTLNGICVVNNIVGKGFRIDKCVTTFTKMDNDAYTEETIVQIWKLVGFDLRTALEDTFVGRPGSVATVQSVPAVMARVLEQHRQAGSITDSIVAGVRTPAYRNFSVNLTGDQLSAGVTISPTPGINFALNTIVLVPAQISL